MLERFETITKTSALGSTVCYLIAVYTHKNKHRMARHHPKRVHELVKKKQLEDDCGLSQFIPSQFLNLSKALFQLIHVYLNNKHSKVTIPQLRICPSQAIIHSTEMGRTININELAAFPRI